MMQRQDRGALPVVAARDPSTDKYCSQNTHEYQMQSYSSRFNAMCVHNCSEYHDPWIADDFKTDSNPKKYCYRGFSTMKLCDTCATNWLMFEQMILTPRNMMDNMIIHVENLLNVFENRLDQKQKDHI